ncbi:hypothetical protein ACRDU6_20195 [Mycolicibacterium sp. ELW1]|uniref:hypothetical protein n=1 Tax=Mycobacteriaceae TaxID=1762 RepID=UPI0011F08614|nr:hypothetical protein [Mycobacterium sp. ELW1]QEN14687.1 hypothetical protein D3H54_16740 [Mycobacterium sp. ELW1]
MTDAEVCNAGRVAAPARTEPDRGVSDFEASDFDVAGFDLAAARCSPADFDSVPCEPLSLDDGAAAAIPCPVASAAPSPVATAKPPIRA